jgi:hypothetical protein
MLKYNIINPQYVKTTTTYTPVILRISKLQQRDNRKQNNFQHPQREVYIITLADVLTVIIISSPVITSLTV